jgi:diacylglycerol O-acyltransferase
MGHHVDVFPVENPDEAEFLVACEGLRRRSLDRSQPRWVMWLLPGLPEGRIGLFMKLHHAVADGVAGAAAFGAFLDLTPAAAAPPAPQWTPTPIPTNDELFRDNVSRRVRLRARSCLGSPSGGHGAGDPSRLAGGAGGLQRGTYAADQPEPPRRLGTTAGDPRQARRR